MEQEDFESLFVVEAKAASDLNIMNVKARISDYSFCIIRGCVSKDAVNRSVERLRQVFLLSSDSLRTPESPESQNFQRLVIGASGDPYAESSPGQFLRAFYNSIEANDVYYMHDIFSTMIHIRDRLCGMPCTVLHRQKNLWNAARIHQYPRGGGFMTAHKDRVASKISNSVGREYFQVVCVMSQKGIDYATGGAFVVSNEKVILIDDYAHVGDIIVYDGRAIHGVERIDAHLPLEVSKVSGRLAGLVTLYSKR
jgi:hypothetical protein